MKLSLKMTRIAGLLLAAGVAALDQWSKAQLVAFAHGHTSLIEICSFFNLVLTRNSGISFGLFAHVQPWMPFFLTLSTSAVALVLLVWLLRATSACTLLALSLIIGGAAGNIMDRVRFGAVTDFLDFHLGSYHWPAFNLADSAIFIGVVILVLAGIVAPSPPHEARSLT